jgi:PAS domain S-box-containing protein
MARGFEDLRFQTLIEHSLDAIALVERDGTVPYVSPSIVRVLGYTPEEFLELGAFEVVHPDDRDTAKQCFAEILEQPTGSQTVVNRARHRNGSWRWIETVSMNQLENPNVRAVVANFRDVTDRLKIEQSIRERDELFRLIVESATGYAIFTLGLDGRIASWNSGAERILGYSEDEILGKHVNVIFTPEDNAGGRAEFEMRAALGEGREDDDRWHVRNGGTRFWANGIMMPLKDEAGRTCGFLKILRDRTQEKLAREALKASEEALREADHRKDEFLAMLAHELRNPLAAINNAVQLSLRGTRTEDLAWSRDVIERQVKNLTRLIDDLLDVSRITRGKIVLQKETIDLGPVMARALESARPLFDAKKQQLTLSIASPALRLFADPTRIEQIFVNLLTNAAKYTPDDGHIFFTACRDRDIVVRVRDDGDGIPPEILPRIFDLFAQGDRATDRSPGGLGIGLTLVKKLVEMHGGTVSAASPGPGSGSEFTIRLPVGSEPVEEKPISTPKPPAPQSMGLRILVVDDNCDTADGLSRLLHASGFQVTTAENAPTALAALRAERADVLLMDIGLPGMDGYMLAEELRKDPSLKETLFIAISGYGQEQDRRRSREAGFDHHLVKPVDYDSLLFLLARPRTSFSAPADG